MGPVEPIVREAMRLSREVGRSGEAADYLEQTPNRWPSLRAEYEHLPRLWRCGVTT
jgi:hypothetical protein